MRRRTITSLLSVGGIALAFMQMMRMRSRPRGWRMIINWLNQNMTQLANRANMMTRMMRRRARM